MVASKFSDNEAEFLFAPYSVFTVESVNYKWLRARARTHKLKGLRRVLETAQNHKFSHEHPQIRG